VAVLLNGQPYSGRYDLYGLDEAVRFYRLKTRQYDEQPGMVIDLNKSYQAVLETERGNITIDLFPDLAPVAVNNFVFLAREGWYDNITFHRVIPDHIRRSVRSRRRSRRSARRASSSGTA